MRWGIDPGSNVEALNQNSGTVALLLGWVHNYLDESDEAIFHLQRAQTNSPLQQKGEFEEAARYYEQAMSEYPEFASTQLGLMGCNWHLGRLDDSARIAEWFRSKVPDMSITTFVRTRPLNSKYYRDTVVAALKGNGS